MGSRSSRINGNHTQVGSYCHTFETRAHVLECVRLVSDTVRVEPILVPIGALSRLVRRDEWNDKYSNKLEIVQEIGMMIIRDVG
jgi:hypothetical protein